MANAIPGVPVVSGDLDAADVDGPADSWNAVGPAPSANGYGSYVVTAAGVWTYTLDNANAAVDALAVGATLNDSFTVTAIDGTSQLVTITITGDQRCAGGDRGGGQRRGDGGSAAGDDGDGHDRLRRRRSRRCPRHVGDARGQRLSRNLRRRCRRRLDRRRQRAGELGVPGHQPAAAVAPGRPTAGADLHRRDRRRPRRDRVATRDDHHQRHQRRRGDHRRHGGERRRGRRRGQRYPRHPGRHR